MSPCSRPYRVCTILVPSRAFLYRSNVEHVANLITTNWNNKIEPHNIFIAFNTIFINSFFILLFRVVFFCYWFNTLSSFLSSLLFFFLLLWVCLYVIPFFSLFLSVLFNLTILLAIFVVSVECQHIRNSHENGFHWAKLFYRLWKTIQFSSASNKYLTDV